MGYFIVVIAQTVVLPILSGCIQLATTGGDAVLTFGKWWVFWGVGTRLLLAGLVQLSGAGPTAQILGSTEPTEQEGQLTRESGTANVGMGIAGLLALHSDWAVPAGLAGGVFLFLAGIMHVTKKDKSAQEVVATWTDLIVGVVVLVLAGYVAWHHLVG